MPNVKVWIIWCGFKLTSSLVLGRLNILLSPYVNEAGHCRRKSQWTSGHVETLTLLLDTDPKCCSFLSWVRSKVHEALLLCSLLHLTITFHSVCIDINVINVREVNSLTNHVFYTCERATPRNVQIWFCWNRSGKVTCGNSLTFVRDRIILFSLLDVRFLCVPKVLTSTLDCFPICLLSFQLQPLLSPRWNRFSNNQAYAAKQTVRTE